MKTYCIFFVLLLSFTFSRSQVSNWTSLGPDKIPQSINSFTGSLGIGRTSCIRFDPDYQNNQLMYIGTPQGGLWMGNQNGWQILNTDKLPNIGISDVLILPNLNQPNTLIVATGDPDVSLDYGFPFLGSSALQSRGLFISNDNGLTWSINSLGNWYDSQGVIVSNFWDYPSGKIIKKLYHNNSHQNEMLAILNTKIAGCEVGYIYKTTNNGLDWFLKQTFSEDFLFDLESKPNDDDVIYISGKTVYKSVDGGNSFVDLNNNGLLPYISGTGICGGATGISRTEIAVTPQDPDILFVLQSNSLGTLHNYFFTSFDGGNSFSQQIVFEFSPWNRSTIDVDPTDWRTVFASASYGISKLTASASGTWSASGWYSITHSDIHELKYAPNSSIIFCSNDGGLAVSATGNHNTWSNISNGMTISQLWSISTSDLNPDIISIGLQDNGTVIHNSDYNNLTGNWAIAEGGDGFATLVDANDPSTIFHTDAQTMQTRIVRIENFGTTESSNLVPLTHPTDDNTFPLTQDPQDPNKLYVGFDELWVSNNLGDSWTQISSFGIPNKKIKNIAICSEDPKNIYINYSYLLWGGTEAGVLFYSSDGGQTWNDRTNGLSGSDYGVIGGIAVDQHSPKIIYVSYRYQYSSHKVMQSVDNGMSWHDFDTGLPNDADFFNIITEKGSKNIYLAASNGVYLYNDDIGHWIPYNTHLPNVTVMENQINYQSNEIFAATFGRGAWKSPLSCPLNNNLNLSGSVTSPKFLEAYNYINSTEAIGSNVVDVRYRATHDINLMPGFSVPMSSEFQGFIHGCDNNGSSINLRKNNELTKIESAKIIYDIKFMLIPNPATENINIKFFGEDEDYEKKEYNIISPLGIKIRTGNLDEGRSVYIGDLQPGTYIFNIKLERESISKRFVKL